MKGESNNFFRREVKLLSIILERKKFGAEIGITNFYIVKLSKTLMKKNGVKNFSSLL